MILYCKYSLGCIDTNNIELINNENYKLCFIVQSAILKFIKLRLIVQSAILKFIELRLIVESAILKYIKLRLIVQSGISKFKYCVL